MDFHRLVARLSELDKALTSQPVVECGEMPPAAPAVPPVSPPSMSVNLNAQGMDNIEQMMKLFQKVNPDMMPKSPAPMPQLGTPPDILSVKPSLPPLKMLPLDVDGPPEPEGDAEIDFKVGGDEEGSNIDDREEGPDLDDEEGPEVDDSDDEEDKDGDDENREESFQDATTEPDEQYKSIDYMNNQLAGGMNGPKDTFPKVAAGDNPMQKVKEADDFRAQIRAELARRLAEAKGAR